MKHFALILISCCMSLAHAQTTNKEDLLKQTVISDFAAYETEKGKILKNFYDLTDDKIDSVDIDLMVRESGLLGMFIVELTDEGSKVTYGAVLTKLQAFIDADRPFYERIKERFATTMAIMQRVALKENWSKDRQDLLNLGMEPRLVAQYDEKLPQLMDGKKTLGELIERTNQQLASAEPRVNLYQLIIEGQLIRPNELQAASIETDRPIVIYFTGYSCVNCRKIEEAVFSDYSLFEQLKNNVVFFSAYVDDRKPLEEGITAEVEINGRTRTAKTVGDYNMFYQIQHYDVVSQPYLVFLDSKLNVLEIATYENARTPEAFQKILDSALVKYASTK